MPVPRRLLGGVPGRHPGRERTHFAPAPRRNEPTFWRRETARWPCGSSFSTGPLMLSDSAGPGWPRRRSARTAGPARPCPDRSELIRGLVYQASSTWGSSGTPCPEPSMRSGPIWWPTTPARTPSWAARWPGIASPRGTWPSVTGCSSARSGRGRSRWRWSSRAAIRPGSWKIHADAIGGILARFDRQRRFDAPSGPQEVPRQAARNRSGDQRRSAP